MALSLPLRVQALAAGGGSAWEEMTTTSETSYGGLSCVLEHPVAVGQVVHLSAPLPKPFRRYDLTDPSYHVYALIRNVRSANGQTRVGVFFLGKTPPKGYHANPSGRYLMSSDTAPAAAPSERRQHTRLDMFLSLRLWRADTLSGAAQEEQTVAENLSRRGARVLTSLPVGKGEVLYLQEIGGTFKTRAEVKNLYIGKDNVPRLNVCFLDAEPPERLIGC
jgi:hypothetical protein